MPKPEENKIELLVPLEAPKEIAYLLFQAARDGCLVSENDARAVWRELVSVAGMHCPENMERIWGKKKTATEPLTKP